MKVLIVGGGGREHALAWKISKGLAVSNVFVAPGNGGTALEPNIENVNIESNDIEALAQFALKNQIELTIVGPEDPLVNGITDRFLSLNLNCFGPSKAAAKLEGSKEYMKEFLQRHAIPTASYKSFTESRLAIAYVSKAAAKLEGSKEYMKEFLQRHAIPTASYKSFTDSRLAIAYVKELGCPIVIKADGLAAGKGVTVALNEKEAVAAIEESLNEGFFGEAGSKIVIEEFLEGEEASFIVLTDGNVILPFASSQDHKARDNGDLGPNTGGMGAYSPAPVVTKMIHQKIMDEIIIPTVQGLNADDTNYCGFLYAGVMIDSKGNLKVLEFNCRFGDPETQPILMRLESDLAKLCLDATLGKLKDQQLKWNPQVALGVVMAADGYPDTYKKGSTRNTTYLDEIRI